MIRNCQPPEWLCSIFVTKLWPVEQFVKQFLTIGIEIDVSHSNNNQPIRDRLVTRLFIDFWYRLLIDFCFRLVIDFCYRLVIDFYDRLVVDFCFRLEIGYCLRLVIDFFYRPVIDFCYRPVIDFCFRLVIDFELNRISRYLLMVERRHQIAKYVLYL